MVGATDSGLIELLQLNGLLNSTLTRSIEEAICRLTLYPSTMRSESVRPLACWGDIINVDDSRTRSRGLMDSGLAAGLRDSVAG